MGKAEEELLPLVEGGGEVFYSVLLASRTGEALDVIKVAASVESVYKWTQIYKNTGRLNI